MTRTVLDTDFVRLSSASCFHVVGLMMVTRYSSLCCMDAIVISLHRSMLLVFSLHISVSSAFLSLVSGNPRILAVVFLP